MRAGDGDPEVGVVGGTDRGAPWRGVKAGAFAWSGGPPPLPRFRPAARVCIVNVLDTHTQESEGVRDTPTHIQYITQKGLEGRPSVWVVIGGRCHQVMRALLEG